MVNYKISFCTVCMNRADHLKKTLIKNILDNINYPNIEFVVLDYNSSDDLLTWANDHLISYIETGILNYYRTEEPQFFHRGHAKNMAFRLASGDILCNVDADNFIGEGFAEYINSEFNKNLNIFLVPLNRGTIKELRDIQGRICVMRNDFNRIKGFDERFREYGFDDHDFANRIKLLGKKKVVIKNLTFLHAITHDDKIRISQEFVTKNLNIILISYISPALSDIIFLYKNGVFEKFTIVDNVAKQSHNKLFSLKHKKLNGMVTIKNSHMIRGDYRIDNEIILMKVNKKWVRFASDKVDKRLYILKYANKEKIFLPIIKEDIINALLMFKARYQNKKILLENKKNKLLINQGGFGEGNLIKNFTDKITFD